MPPNQNPNDVNRRGGRRIGLRRHSNVTVPGHGPQAVTTSDIGIEGLSFHCARPIAPGTRCALNVELPLRDRSAMVNLKVKTVYSSYCGADGFRIGAVFTDLDAESTAALREFAAPGA